MGNFKAIENVIINSLIADSNNFGLNEKESLTYVKSRFGREISAEITIDVKEVLILEIMQMNGLIIFQK